MMCCVIGRSLPDATAPRRSSGSVSGSGLPSPRARRSRKAARSPRSCPGARARLDDHSVLRGGVVRNRLRVLRRLVSWSAAPRASASSNGEEAPETGPPLVSTDGAGTTPVPGWRNWSDAPDLKSGDPRVMRVRVPLPASAEQLAHVAGDDDVLARLHDVHRRLDSREPADLAAHELRVLADAAREDDRVEPAERHLHRRDGARNAVAVDVERRRALLLELTLFPGAAERHEP